MKLNEISKFKKTDMDILDVKEKDNHFRVDIVAENEENIAEMVNYVKERSNMKVIGKTFSDYHKGHVLTVGINKYTDNEKTKTLSDSDVFQKFRNVIEEIEGVI